MHRVRRDVGAAVDDLAFRRKYRRGRPSAHVVPRIDIGSPIIVDPYRDEALVDEIDDGAIGVCRFVHHVTPVAPYRRYGEQDRLGASIRLVEWFGAPFSPADLSGAVGSRRKMEIAQRRTGLSCMRGRPSR